MSFISCSYYYYNTIKQSTCIYYYFHEKFFFKNILSLLAGKSEQICTAFPLTTFSRQKYARRAFKKFSAKSLIQFLVQKFLSETSQKFKNQVKRAMFSCNLSRTRLLWKARCGLGVHYLLPA